MNLRLATRLPSDEAGASRLMPAVQFLAVVLEMPPVSAVSYPPGFAGFTVAAFPVGMIPG